MTLFQKMGLFSCLGIIFSCFLNWAYYPDLDKYFSAFFTEKNYYGKPGKLLLFFALTGIVFYLVNKPWSQRLNLIFSGLCIAYSITTFLRFTSGYDGYLPEAQWGIYVLLAGALGHVVSASASMALVKNAQQEPINSSAE